jgi:isochorismate hydrolase
MHNPTNLNPSDVQVLFADLQKQIVARNKTNEPQTLAKSAIALAQLAHVFSLPVTVSVVPQGTQKPELMPELEKEVKGAPQFVRMSPNPFLHQETKSALAANGRKTLVIAGCAMEIVMLHSVTSAIENGYRVLVAIDASGGLSERTERAALHQMEAFGAEVTSVATIATSLEPNFKTELGQKMFGVVQQILRD